MLSWSGRKSEAEVDLGAVATGDGDVGIPLGGELLRFATEAARLDSDVAEMGDARDALTTIAGEAMMIDAAAVAANFHMMTRLADGTGARYPASQLQEMARTIDWMSAADMASRR